jgi:hypothetical protein
MGAMTKRSHTSILVARLREIEFEFREYERNGEKYNEGEIRPPNTHEVIVSDEDEQSARRALKELGLENFEALLRFDYYKELPNRDVIFAPVKSHTLEASYRILKRSTERLPESDPVFSELTQIINAVTHQPSVKMNNPVDDDIIHVPRVIVIDQLHETQAQFPIILEDLNPYQLRSKFEDRWDDLLNELTKKFRPPIANAMEEAISNTRNDQPAPAKELLEKYILDGLYHEIAHPLSVNLTPEMEKYFFRLAMDMTKGRLFFKNMLKAMSGINKYRQKFYEDFPEPMIRTKALMMYMFGSEMFADLFAIFMKKRLGQEHVYVSEYGEKLSPEMLDLFENTVLPHLQTRDKRKRSLVFTKNEQGQSKMYQGQQIQAS